MTPATIEPQPDLFERSREELPGNLNLTIALVQTCLLLGSAAVFAQADTWGVILTSLLVFILSGHSAYHLLHEAEHFLLHPNRRVNDTVGVWLGLFFPVCFHFLRQTHFHHHLVNRGDDEAFELVLPGEPRWWKPIQIYGILTGLFYIVVTLTTFVLLLNPAWLEKVRLGFDRATDALMRSLQPRFRSALRLEAAAVILFQLLFHFGLGLSWERHLALLLCWGVTWSTVQYLHHYGTERHVLLGARDLRVPRWIEFILLNHHWHARHHRHPNVSWLHLPKLGQGPSEPREPALRAWLRQWRGPLSPADLPVSPRHDQ